MQRTSSIFTLCCCLAVLQACAEKTEEGENGSVENDPRLVITFSAGPNQGRHEYRWADTSTATLLTYSQPNDVTFLNLNGLISNDGLEIDSLRRFTVGSLQQGANPASNWLPRSGAKGVTECGRVEWRDDDNTKAYNTAFGVYLDCTETQISKLGRWRKAHQGSTQVRWVEGFFEDRLRVQMSMDSAPFETFETDIRVEFRLEERAAN